MTKKINELVEIQTRTTIPTAITLGIALFIALSVVVYFVFPLLLRSEVSSIHTHLENHEKLDAHPNAHLNINALENRVLLLEAAMHRIDPGFYSPIDTTK